MANETTTSTLDDLTNASLTVPVIIYALSERPGLAISACREFDLTQGHASNVAKLPVETSFGARRTTAAPASIPSSTRPREPRCRTPRSRRAWSR